MTEDYEGWTSAQMIDEIKATISMWDLLDHMEIDYPRRSYDGVKISIRDEGIPSCHIYEDGFYDYGSGVGGSVIDFYMLVTGKSKLARSCRELLSGEISSGTVRRSVKELVILTDRFLSESAPLHDHARDVEWFLRDKWAPINIATAAAAGVRATKHGVWIPFWHNDEVVGGKVRGWSGVKTAMKGSTFTTGLWSPFTAPRPTKNLVLCEGESDTMAIHQELSPGFSIEIKDLVFAGLPSGAGKWNEKWLTPWLRPEGDTTVFVMQDNDESGQKVADKIKKTHERVAVFQTSEDVRSDLDKEYTPWVEDLRNLMIEGF